MNPTWEVNQGRPLPSDLPRSLNDRKRTSGYGPETEIYDAWQEQPQYLSSPTPLSTNFDISLHDTGSAIDSFGDDSDSRLTNMLAAQARLRARVLEEGEDAILGKEDLPFLEKKKILQDVLAMAASNGEADRIRKLLSGPAKDFIEIDAPDADGNVPLIYASCFGHVEAVVALVENGAKVEKSDNASWTSLMWAITNRQKDIVKYLLDHGASLETKTSSGRSAFDFVVPNSDMADYLQKNGYMGNLLPADDFYSSGGFGPGNFEEEFAENEMRQRMMMESAINLEVDLENLALDDQADSPIDDFEEDGQEFHWDRCLHDQMFVFQEADLDRILDVVITKMTPSRSASQKPIPANLLFLAARYAHYHSSKELLEVLLSKAFARINSVVEVHQWDMTMLAFWVSNSTLLLHYMRKDAGLVDSTAKYQLALEELIHEIFILIIRDAERRMDKHLDKAMLEYESIPGFEDVTFQNEWKIFKSRPKAKTVEPPEKRFRPPSPKRLAQISPRNITSLLSSTLFVLELYDIHSVILVQVISQLLYWLGAEIFNRIMDNRKYLARTKALQIRMNVLTLEEWARSNNRQPEHYEHGSTVSSGETTTEAARRHLEPVLQLLQWLQALSSIGDDFEALISTIQQLPRLNPTQLIHSAKYYHAEVGEKGLTKSATKYLTSLQEEIADRKAQEKRDLHKSQTSLEPAPPATPVKESQNGFARSPGVESPNPLEERLPDHLFLDPATVLPFHLPSITDMLVTYGAGFGGRNRERERKYIPNVPHEFLSKLDFTNSNKNSLYEGKTWDTSD